MANVAGPNDDSFFLPCAVATAQRHSTISIAALRTRIGRLGIPIPRSCPQRALNVLAPQIQCAPTFLLARRAIAVHDTFAGRCRAGPDATSPACTPCQPFGSAGPRHGRAGPGNRSLLGRATPPVQEAVQDRARRRRPWREPAHNDPGGLAKTRTVGRRLRRRAAGSGGGCCGGGGGGGGGGCGCGGCIARMRAGRGTRAEKLGPHSRPPQARPHARPWPPRPHRAGTSATAAAAGYARCCTTRRDVPPPRTVLTHLCDSLPRLRERRRRTIQKADRCRRSLTRRLVAAAGRQAKVCVCVVAAARWGGVGVGARI